MKSFSNVLYFSANFRRCCEHLAEVVSISPNILSISSEFHRYPRIRGINRIFLQRSQKDLENLQISAAVFRKLICQKQFIKTFIKNNITNSANQCGSVTRGECQRSCKQPPSRSISNSLSASLPAEKLTKENHFKNCVPNHCRSTTAFVFPLQEN